ncbi:MAG TPA: HEAT repeat domain-containing protein, partial [Pirellulales bacterium]
MLTFGFKRFVLAALIAASCIAFDWVGVAYCSEADDATPLAKALAMWMERDVDLASIGNEPVRSKAEAKAIVAALDALYTDQERRERKRITPSLHSLTALFQNFETREAYDVLSAEGLTTLRKFVKDALDGKELDDPSDVLFILKILAGYQQREDVAFIVQAARKPLEPDAYMWHAVLETFDDEHPHSPELMKALAVTPPSGFVAVAFLDMSNALARAGKAERHPFDSPAGRKQIEAWLRDDDEKHFSYAHSAAAALPFIAKEVREPLLAMAEKHPDVNVRMEAAWARVKSGNETGVDSLLKLCLDPSYSRKAVLYLQDLGLGDRVPAKCREPEFQAISEMAEWLAHPQEFGRPPDAVDVYDSRELYWPPTKDKRRLTLVKYTYKGDNGNEPRSGIGMVGSVTFALFGEATPDLPPEDVYGLHCCWELMINKATGAP